MRGVLLILCCVVCCALLTGCNEDATVYFDENCNLVYEDGSSANPLELSPKDKIKWVNDNDFDITVDFDGTTLFGQPQMTVKAGKSKTTVVKPGVSNYEEDITVNCGDGGSGNPKVKVGDDDEGSN